MLYLLIPGAFVSALICFPWMRRLVLLILILWIFVYCYTGRGHAEESLVSCQMNNRGDEMVVGDGWCRLFHRLKDNARDDISEGATPGPAMRRCLASLEEVTSDPTGRYRIERIHICQAAVNGAELDRLFPLPRS